MPMSFQPFGTNQATGSAPVEAAGRLRRRRFILFSFTCCLRAAFLVDSLERKKERKKEMYEETRIIDEAEFKLAQKFRKQLISRILELRKAAVVVGDLYHHESHKRLVAEINELQCEVRLLDSDCDVWLYRSLDLGTEPRQIVLLTWESALAEYRDNRLRSSRSRRIDQDDIRHIKDVG